MDEYLTLSDLVLFLVASTLISGVVGHFLDMVWSRAFSMPDLDVGRIADASERIADALEERNLAAMFEDKDKEKAP